MHPPVALGELSKLAPLEVFPLVSPFNDFTRISGGIGNRREMPSMAGCRRAMRKRESGKRRTEVETIAVDIDCVHGCRMAPIGFYFINWIHVGHLRAFNARRNQGRFCFSAPPEKGPPQPGSDRRPWGFSTSANTVFFSPPALH